VKKTLLAFAAAETIAMSLSIKAYGQAAPAVAPPASDLQEVVVTATRRAERLQNVPLDVSAISGAQLSQSGFQNLQDVQYRMPGVQFGVSPNDAGFRLRGVGTAGGFASASEQNVGTVIDGVVVPFGNPVSSLGDLERVEVLKGPQGTQFGKNASSGVVSITTRRPDLRAFSVSGFASYAQLNEHDVHGLVNMPLADELALSVYGFDRKHDGFVNNIIRNEEWGGEHFYGTRAKLLWQVTDDFSAYLIGDWSIQKRTGPGQLWTLNRLPSFADPLMAARFGPLLALGITPGLQNDKSAEEYPGYGGEKDEGASLELNWLLGEYTLTSVTAYRKEEDFANVFAIDGTNLPIFTAQESPLPRDFLSQELRVTSPAGNLLEYVSGLYLSRTNVGYGNITCSQLRPVLPFDPVTINITAGCGTTATTSKSIAAFADGSVHLTDTLRLLGGVRLTQGVRLTHDKVDAESYSAIDPSYPPGVGPNGFVAPYTPRPVATGGISKTDWSGRFGADYKPAGDLLVFGTVARGYLGPTVTFSGLTGLKDPVKPQTVTDITVGAKTQWLDRHLTLNANVFYDKYKNLQTSVFNGLEFLTENAGGFTAKGFEIETTFKVTQQLAVNAAYTLSRTEFTDYVTACPNSLVAAGAAAVAAQCNAPGSTATTALFQAKGFPLPGAPEHTASVGADYHRPVGSLLVDAAANYYYRSKVQYDVANAYSVQGSYGIVGGKLGVGDPDGLWRVAVFVRNAFDKRFQVAVIGLPFADAGGEVNWNTREARRTVGVSIEEKF
jgi:iron complex outermembrane receptor protein